MDKPKNAIEQIIGAPSTYPGDESSYYRATADSVLGKADDIANATAALHQLCTESGCTAQEAFDAFASIFAAEPLKEKVKVDG